MTQIIGAWGNNLAVRIPREINIFEKGEHVEIVPVKEGLLIKPAKRQRSMAELLSADSGIFHGEFVDFGPAAGEETEL